MELDSPSLARRVEPHDRNQLEVKLAYLLGSSQRENYQVESFMFLPATLGVDAKSYTLGQFYADTSAFFRLKTPAVSLHNLAAELGATEWFDPLIVGSEQSERRQTRQLRILGCIYRAAIREERETLLTRLEDPDAPLPASEEVQTFVAELESALTRVRHLEAHVTRPERPEAVRETWSAVDEFISLKAEQACTALVAAIDSKAPTNTSLNKAREQLASVAVREFRYRRDRDYPSYVRTEGANETLPFRRRILKRMMYSALYLDARQDDSAITRDVVGMVAAALAMLFAVLAAGWAQTRWSIFSVPFVTVMVVSYMIKDRIKERAKQFLGKRFFARWLSDTNIRILNTDGKVIGRCRESFRVVRPDKVSPDVLDVRHRQKSGIAESGRPERVVHYVKDVSLRTDRMRDDLDALEGLNDIIRFNLNRLRARMDQTSEEYVLVHPETRRLMTIPCARVYHVNVLLKLTTGSGAGAHSEIDHIRVIMDQSGIKRIEQVTGRGEASPDGFED